MRAESLRRPSAAGWPGERVRLAYPVGAESGCSLRALRCRADRCRASHRNVGGHPNVGACVLLPAARSVVLCESLSPTGKPLSILASGLPGPRPKRSAGGRVSSRPTDLPSDRSNVGESRSTPRDLLAPEDARKDLSRFSRAKPNRCTHNWSTLRVYLLGIVRCSVRSRSGGRWPLAYTVR